MTASIDWDRRHRLMRLHTCLHLLGSLIPVPVTGCGISPDSGRIDFDLPESTLDRDTLTTQLNALISRDTPRCASLIYSSERTSFDGQLVYHKRGVYRMPTVVVSSLFPFHLFQSVRRIPCETSIAATARCASTWISR